MKKFLLFLSIFSASCVYAQSTKTLIGESDAPTLIERISDNRDSHINLEFASSANAYFTEGEFDESSFKMNRVRLEIYGKLNSSLSYHFRQSYNKYSNPYSVDNISSSIEYANIKWRQNDKFDIVVGKQFLAVAGYEGYVNGLLVREFSEFNNNFEIFVTGIKGSYYMTPDQHFYFQVTNNRNGSDEDMYMYGLPPGIKSSKIPLLATANWTGWFADRSINLMYSASVGKECLWNIKERNFCRGSV